MPVYYLCSYKPLIITEQGRRAVQDFGLAPYIDASCRKEPDFQASFPSISAVCRGALFAPRLKVDDVVVYITVKGKYQGEKISHWRLVAVLEVKERFENHEEAATWYRSQGIKPPNNCIVKGNSPTPFEKTAGVQPVDKYGDPRFPDQVIKRWDGTYKLRTRKHGDFLACKALFLELYNPPILYPETMVKIFGRIPATRNPPSISQAQFNQLLLNVLRSTQ